MIVMSLNNLRLLKFINKLVDDIYIWTYIIKSLLFIDRYV